MGKSGACVKPLVVVLATLVGVAPLAVTAAESATRVGAYLFATGISGEANVGDTTADVDVGFYFKKKPKGYPRTFIRANAKNTPSTVANTRPSNPTSSVFSNPATSMRA